MTNLINHPENFVAEMLDGFCDVHRDLVRRVPGGVVSLERRAEQRVSVVIGGGAGHYPWNCGLAGPGLADGAVVGEVFTSPSTEDVISVARAADRGGGVLLCIGNYAGDRLNFGLARDRLQADGVDCRLVVLTDDIGSAPPSARADRRGIAGSFVVYKLASAAARDGLGLEEVGEVASLANDRTRTLGVAFSGTRLPGRDEPLFTLPDGMMGLGLGIHGEPGIEEVPIPGADGLAELLVSKVLEDFGDELDGGDVAVLLNGLGATKQEELFVLWGGVARRLRERGLRLVAPLADELVTSLDMAGCSLTLTALDERTVRWWQRPVWTPAVRIGAQQPVANLVGPAEEVSGAPEPKEEEEPQAAAGQIRPDSALAVELLEATVTALRAAADHLGRLDSVAGDGDHGTGMVRGAEAAHLAAQASAQRGAPVGDVLTEAARAWAAHAGGTSGALWGGGLEAAAGQLPAAGATAEEALDAARTAVARVAEMGGAQRGDKTMLDAAYPWLEELERALGAGQRLPDALSSAAEAARRAAEETAPLRPKIGRARPLAERSVGTADPGATSFAVVTGVLGRRTGVRN